MYKDKHVTSSKCNYCILKNSVVTTLFLQALTKKEDNYSNQNRDGDEYIVKTNSCTGDTRSRDTDVKFSRGLGHSTCSTWSTQ